MRDPEARRHTLFIAEAYRLLAERAKERSERLARKRRRGLKVLTRCARGSPEGERVDTIPQRGDTPASKSIFGTEVTKGRGGAHGSVRFATRKA
jgi:hypothetical protein